MMVDQALAEVVPSLPDAKALLEAPFDMLIDDELHQDVLATLYTDRLLITLQHNAQTSYLSITLNFDLIFELLTKATENSKKRRQPCGLRFERFGKFLDLKGRGQPGLMAWRDQLEGRINQRGFHELFKPIKKIGKGNFATVYLVIRHEDGGKYAAKAFSKQGTFGQEKGKESLVNEIDIMRRFRHKNLMKLQGVFESQNSVYVSVEMLEGGQLCDKIKGRHKFSSGEIKTVMKGILEGLEVMHAQGIMHRDLKPENILLRKEGDFDCVIADFGLAESALNDPYLFVRCGTPGYVAPEVVNLKDMKAKYSPICDLFSVGVILHILALHKPPFPGKEYNEVLAQNRACSIDFQAALYSNLPDTWLDLLKALLQKDPLQRISATKALNHEFFSKDNMFSQFSKERTSQMLSPLSQNISEECQSPLLTTKNNARKNPLLLRQDSCLKFKMKENLLTGRSDQNGDTVDEIDSPGFRHRPVRSGVESRFKKMAK